VKVLNGFNGKMREESSQGHETFTSDPNVELPDTVGMYRNELKLRYEQLFECFLNRLA
jgi:hypothetical protein